MTSIEILADQNMKGARGPFLWQHLIHLGFTGLSSFFPSELQTAQAMTDGATTDLELSSLFKTLSQLSQCCTLSSSTSVLNGGNFSQHDRAEDLAPCPLASRRSFLYPE